MPERLTENKRSPGRHMMVGSAWMIGLRWGTRLIGVVSTIILARLLTPADFGIVAIAMLFVGLLEILNQTGQKLVIIRHSAPTREHYDSAWTLSVCLGLAIGAAVFAAAPLAGIFFHEPRAVPVMRLLALRAAMGGFENIGAVDFRRDLQFNRFFIYGVLPKIVSFAFTITFAIIWRNYWALVGGILVGQCAVVACSFAMHPYRPRISREKLGEMWSFSFWTLFKTIGGYLNFQVDQMMVAAIAGAASMGRYSVAEDVASSPSREVNEPMVAVLFPVMATVQGNPAMLRELYLRVFAWSAMICTSTSVGIALVSQDFVQLVLGPRWTSLAPLIPWLALSSGLLGLSSGAYSTFDVMGKPRLSAQMQWVRLLFLTAAIVPVAIMTRDLVFIAATRLIITLIFMPTLFFAVGTCIGVSPRDYLVALWRPLAAALIMVVVVIAINSFEWFRGDVRLAVDVLMGGAAFVTSLLLLWTISGRPNSPERDLTNLLRERLARFAAA